MPPRAKAGTGLTSLIESGSEPDLDSFDAPESNSGHATSQNATRGRPRGRPPAAANRVTKPAQRGGKQPAGRADKGAATRGARTTGRRGRPSNTAPPPEPEPVPEPEAEAVEPTPVVAKPRRGRPKSLNKTAAVEDKNASSSPAPKAGRGRPARTKPPPVDPVSVELPAEAMEVDAPEAEEVPVEDIEQEVTVEEQHGMEEIAEDDPNDATLRKRLRDLTKKYSSLEARHNELRDVGVKEAERNYARLKKQAAENTAAADKLIAELKAELAAQTALAKKAEAAEAKVPALQTKVAELSTSLTDARSEIKTVNTKLTAARNTEANIKAPGSALKPNAAGNRGVSSEVVQAAQAKEDLYGDLTGLIIRGMKHVDDEEVFDCLQTGRNGTLHFKLALSSSDAADNYDDVQYTYLPQLNPDRDSELMAVLPDFLVEEITFPRPHASKFYTRVIKSLTERVE